MRTVKDKDGVVRAVLLRWGEKAPLFLSLSERPYEGAMRRAKKGDVVTVCAESMAYDASDASVTCLACLVEVETVGT